jgi:hypothetical protein
MPFIQILIPIELVEPHFEVNMEARMMDIINMKVNFMEMNKEITKEGEIIKVVAVIKVNNQTSIQIAITAGNLGTW